MLRHNLLDCFVFAGFSLLTMAAGQAVAQSAPCLTASGAPEADAAAILAQNLIAATDGSAIYIERFELRDVDGDGLNDIILMRRDESYDGNPVYGLSYYKGAPEGFCGTAIFDGKASLLGAPYDLAIEPAASGYPTVSFVYQAADPAARKVMPMAETFVFSNGDKGYVGLK